MERREAADFLGVSLSTLDRLAAQGRLTKGRARRKTRPVTVYDEGELQRLKSELEQQGSRTTTACPPATKPQDAVGFRLDPYYVAQLKAKGAPLGMSAGEYARKLVIQALEQEGMELIREELSALRRSLAETKPQVVQVPAAERLEPLRQELAELRQTLTQRQPVVPASEAARLEQLGRELSTLREGLAEMFYLLLITKLEASEDEAAEIVTTLTRKG